ncbi:hypothetical protein VTN96DRAFT_7796 [Rasamsonia emersonii]
MFSTESVFSVLPFYRHAINPLLIGFVHCVPCDLSSGVASNDILALQASKQAIGPIGLMTANCVRHFIAVTHFRTDWK